MLMSGSQGGRLARRTNPKIGAALLTAIYGRYDSEKRGKHLTFIPDGQKLDNVQPFQALTPSPWPESICFPFQVVSVSWN